MIVEKILEATDFAYAAGLVDGEGSVVIHKCKPQQTIRRSRKSYSDKTPRYTVDLKVAMSDRRAMYWLKDNFGGSIHARIDKRNPNYRPMFDWSLRANKASAVLKILLPYLKTKALQATQAIYFQDNLIRKTGWKGDGIQPEELAQREKAYLLNRQLNQGYDPEVEGGYGDY